MKQFIQNCIVFCLLSFPVLGGYAIVKPLFHKPYLVDKSINTIMTGDSHVQCAIQSDRINGLENVAINSEGYLYSYYKLREILKVNPQIQHVILGFSYHNLSAYYDVYMTGEHAKAVLPRFADLFTARELFELIRTNPGVALPVLRSRISTSPNTYGYIGRYFSHDSDTRGVDEALMKQRIDFQYFANSKAMDFSRINLMYLKKIVNLCRDKHVTLVLLNTPLHEQYKRNIPEKFIKKYNMLIHQFNLPIIEFKALNLTSEHFLPDGDHVNSSGALLTTQHIKQILESQASGLNL